MGERGTGVGRWVYYGNGEKRVGASRAEWRKTERSRAVNDEGGGENRRGEKGVKRW